MSPTLCKSCNRRPRYFDGKVTHAYCSKTCAAVGQTTINLCEVCKKQPKYQDVSGKTHPYCGKTCAGLAAPATSVSSSSRQKANGTCQAPNCMKRVFVNNYGIPSDYCSLSHKELTENICLVCRKTAKIQNSHYCSQGCLSRASRMAPALLQVPQNHVSFRSVEEQFKASWRHTKKPCPTVRGVFKIVTSEKAVDGYNRYRNRVEARGNFTMTSRTAGNENRRWHGTRRECSLGDDGSQTSLCNSSTCSLCSIIKHSFDLNFFGSKTGCGRFGRGIYTSSTASKSDDYSSNVTPSRLKAVLLNKVVVGKGYKMYRGDSTLTAPPTGYDSVLAEVGAALNHDELVVYTNNAIRPSFLVTYDRK